jgi:hypothetical protein
MERQGFIQNIDWDPENLKLKRVSEERMVWILRERRFRLQWK